MTTVRYIPHKCHRCFNDIILVVREMTTTMTRLIPVIVMLAFMVAPVYAGDYQDGLDAYEREDYKTAFEKWKPLAEQGNAWVQNRLGFMYDKGRGVTQDYKEAAKWYRLSAEQGDAEAQFNLGVMYNNGLGVIQDYIQAHKWYNFAGANGNEDGRDNRDIIEKKMTPAQIAEAQKLAREWMERYGKK